MGRSGPHLIHQSNLTKRPHRRHIWMVQWYSPGGASVHPTWYVLPWAYHSPKPKRHLDWFSHFCTAHGSVLSGMPGHVLPLKIDPWHGVIWTPSNTWFLGPKRVNTPNGISIGSAIFAQFTAVRRRACTGMSFPLKIAPSHGTIWTPCTKWFLGPTLVQIPNSTSIGSAVFSQLMAERPCTLQWAALSSSKLPIPMRSI